MPRIDIAGARQRGAQLLSGFTSGQKTMLVIAGAATVVGGLLFMRMAGSTEMAPLYTNLPADSAAEVTSALESSGVDYDLADGGSTILVPRSEVHRVRLDLSADGLPRDGAPGYDLLDDQGITTSEFRQRVDYQRAMEGELAATIEAIDGVDSAIVRLVMPEDDLFSGDAQHPSASVLVSTAPDRPLAAGQVQAVVHLVASSIEGLEAENVTVADNTGRLLSSSGTDGTLAASGDARASQTAAFEAALSARIMDVLAPVTGPNGARVSTTAQLNFDRRSSTTETYGPADDAAVVSENIAEETFEGSSASSAAPSGVLGPDGTSTAADGSDSNTYNARNSQTVYGNDRVQEVVEQAPGDVERLSVAVLVDETGGYDIRAIEQLVAASAGLDPERDTIEVTQLPFDTSQAEANEQALADARAAEARTDLFSLLRTVASVLIVAIVLFLAWRSHKKASRYPLAIPLPGADPDDRGLPPGDSAALDGIDGELQALLAAPSEADLERDAVQGQITDLIDRQPDDVAQVLRSWMAER